MTKAYSLSLPSLAVLALFAFPSSAQGMLGARFTAHGQDFKIEEKEDGRVHLVHDAPWDMSLEAQLQSMSMSQPAPPVSLEQPMDAIIEHLRLLCDESVVSNLETWEQMAPQEEQFAAILGAATMALKPHANVQGQYRAVHGALAQLAPLVPSIMALAAPDRELLLDYERLQRTYGRLLGLMAESPNDPERGNIQQLTDSGRFLASLYLNSLGRTDAFNTFADPYERRVLIEDLGESILSLISAYTLVLKNNKEPWAYMTENYTYVATLINALDLCCSFDEGGEKTEGLPGPQSIAMLRCNLAEILGTHGFYHGARALYGAALPYLPHLHENPSPNIVLAETVDLLLRQHLEAPSQADQQLSTWLQDGLAPSPEHTLAATLIGLFFFPPNPMA